jgi:hypothetical protein
VGNISQFLAWTSWYLHLHAILVPDTDAVGTQRISKLSALGGRREGTVAAADAQARHADVVAPARGRDGLQQRASLS